MRNNRDVRMVRVLCWLHMLTAIDIQVVFVKTQLEDGAGVKKKSLAKQVRFEP